MTEPVPWPLLLVAVITWVLCLVVRGVTDYRHYRDFVDPHRRPRALDEIHDPAVARAYELDNAEHADPPEAA